MGEDHSLVKVFSGSDLEAALVRHLLESHGIRAHLEDERMGRLTPHLATVKVSVAKREAEEAMRLLEVHRGTA